MVVPRRSGIAVLGQIGHKIVDPNQLQLLDTCRLLGPPRVLDQRDVITAFAFAVRIIVSVMEVGTSAVAVEDDD